MSNIIWTDLETTGLDPRKCGTIEVACIATDEHLNDIGRFHRLVKVDAAAEMEPWPLRQHTDSGLLAECEANGLLKAQVEEEWVHWLAGYGDLGTLTLAGGGVHFDYGFIRSDFPQVYKWFRYRLVDISVIRTARNLALGRSLDHGFPGKEDRPHRAMPDIEMSLQAARGMWSHLAAGTLFMNEARIGEENRQQELENTLAAYVAADRDRNDDPSLLVQDALSLLDGHSGVLADGREWSCRKGKLLAK